MAKWKRTLSFILKITLRERKAITLKREDGKFEIINPDGSRKVTDAQRNVIGKQEKGVLTYDTGKESEKLVHNMLIVPYGKRFEVVLVEGSVHIQQQDEKPGHGTQYVLKPGEKGRFDKSDHTISKRKVATSIYIAWIKGELVFQDMAFEDILKKLERHNGCGFDFFVLFLCCFVVNQKTKRYV